VHEVVVICAREFCAPLGELLRRAALGDLAQLSEEVVAPGGRGDLDRVRRFGTGVPERVRDAARLEDLAAGPGDVVAVADPYPDLSADDVGELVLPVVGVRRNEPPGIERLLDDRESSTVILPGTLKSTPRPPSHTDAPSLANRDELPRRAGFSLDLRVYGFSGNQPPNQADIVGSTIPMPPPTGGRPTQHPPAAPGA
jgi:hypothetical protein